jgi:hypothetical protein
LIKPYLFTSAFNISHSDTNLLQFEVGISNDLASLLHSRSSVEIITYTITYGRIEIVYYLTSSCVNWAVYGMSGPV